MYTQTRTFILAMVLQEVTEARQEAKIWMTYALSPYLRAHDLKVSVQNGKATLTAVVDEDVETRRDRVTLRGTADSAAAWDTAGRLAMSTRGVVSVDNQLVVDSTKSTVVDSAKRSASQVQGGISDSWITTKKSTLLYYSSNVAGSDISVSTQRGIVTLSGKVHCGAERDLAVELAQNVRGVKSVDARGLTF
ncbi:BON domain-containing protein [Azotobacter armeniacus]